MGVAECDDFDLCMEGYDVEFHLKRCCFLFFTDNTAEDVKNNLSIIQFIDNISFHDLKSEIFQLPALTRSQFSDYKNSPMSELWPKWTEIAKKAATSFDIAYRMKEAVTCYFACLNFYFWLHQNNAVKYDSNNSFLLAYPQYTALESRQISLLRNSYILPRLTSEKLIRYKPGGGTKLSSSGQNKDFADLLYLYETEGNAPASTWSTKRLDTGGTTGVRTKRAARPGVAGKRGHQSGSADEGIPPAKTLYHPPSNEHTSLSAADNTTDEFVYPDSISSSTNGTSKGYQDKKPGMDREQDTSMTSNSAPATTTSCTYSSPNNTSKTPPPCLSPTHNRSLMLQLGKRTASHQAASHQAAKTKMSMSTWPSTTPTPTAPIYANDDGNGKSNGNAIRQHLTSTQQFEDLFLMDINADAPLVLEDVTSDSRDITRGTNTHRGGSIGSNVDQYEAVSHNTHNTPLELIHWLHEPNTNDSCTQIFPNCNSLQEKECAIVKKLTTVSTGNEVAENVTISKESDQCIADGDNDGVTDKETPWRSCLPGAPPNSTNAFSAADVYTPQPPPQTQSSTPLGPSGHTHTPMPGASTNSFTIVESSKNTSEPDWLSLAYDTYFYPFEAPFIHQKWRLQSEEPSAQPSVQATKHSVVTNNYPKKPLRKQLHLPKSMIPAKQPSNPSMVPEGIMHSSDRAAHTVVPVVPTPMIASLDGYLSLHTPNQSLSAEYETSADIQCTDNKETTGTALALGAGENDENPPAVTTTMSHLPTQLPD